MKNKPIWDFSDKRASVRHQTEQDKKRRERILAEKLLGKNYFTNPKAIIFENEIELSKRK